jgi:acyl-coenzyme A synthetase/AMP-(fatty) acid ligase
MRTYWNNEDAFQKEFRDDWHITGDRALEAFVKVGKKYNILGKTKQEIIRMYGM